MKKIERIDVKKIKSLLFILLAFFALSNGITKYFKGDVVTSDIVVEHSTQEPAASQESLTLGEPADQSETASVPVVIKININKASSEELQCLSGIGPTKSESIIFYREEFGGFQTIEEITEVKGIGDATYLKIKDFIAVD